MGNRKFLPFTSNKTSGDRGYGPNSGFTLAQTVDVLQSMVSTSLGSGDIGQLCDDLTRLCGVFGCVDSLYKLAMVEFGMPKDAAIPNGASLQYRAWEAVFKKVCAEEKKLRKGDGWMRNGLLHRLKYFEIFELHTAARRLKEAACPTLAWLVERRGGNAENARDPLTNYTIRMAVQNVLYLEEEPYIHETYGPIAEWDVADVDDMHSMFFDARRFNGDLSRWDVSNVNNMGHMFDDATSFNGDLSRWDVSTVNYMRSMFRNATSFNGDLSRWNVSIVNNMYGMFWGATSFNSDLSRWNVSNVTIKDGMFQGATSFNSDLSRWDVSSVNYMSSMFRDATSFNSDLSRWDVSIVKDMGAMFWAATSFNSDLSRWDVSDVEDMAHMFQGATSFNSDLSRWDVSKVETMVYMFGGATNFNSELSCWDMSRVMVIDRENMFLGAANYNPKFGEVGISTLSLYPAPRVHGEPKDLFNRKLFPPLPEKLPELPGLPGLPELPELSEVSSPAGVIFVD